MPISSNSKPFLKDDTDIETSTLRSQFTSNWSYQTACHPVIVLDIFQTGLPSVIFTALGGESGSWKPANHRRTGPIQCHLYYYYSNLKTLILKDRSGKPDNYWRTGPIHCHLYYYYSNSKTLMLKDRNVRSIWTCLTASPSCTTNTNKHYSSTRNHPSWAHTHMYFLTVLHCLVFNENQSNKIASTSDQLLRSPSPPNGNHGPGLHQSLGQTLGLNSRYLG